MSNQEIHNKWQGSSQKIPLAEIQTDSPLSPDIYKQLSKAHIARALGKSTD